MAEPVRHHPRRRKPRYQPRRKRGIGLSDLVWLGSIGVGAYFVTLQVVPLGRVMLQSPEERAAIERSVTYSGCNEVRAAGKAPIYAGQPGYRDTMDGDGDGIACEPYY